MTDSGGVFLAVSGPAYHYVKNLSGHVAEAAGIMGATSFARNGVSHRCAPFFEGSEVGTWSSCNDSALQLFLLFFCPMKTRLRSRELCLIIANDQRQKLGHILLLKRLLLISNCFTYKKTNVNLWLQSPVVVVVVAIVAVVY